METLSDSLYPEPFMRSHASDGSSVGNGSPEFTTTHWSVVVAAGASGSPKAAQALEQLCGTYWYPLYAYARRYGQRPEDAQDLVQSFFARLIDKGYLPAANPERGKFRTFLLTSLQRFLVNEWRKSQAQKRGGGAFLVPWDEDQTEGRYLAESPDTPEKLYEKRWAWALMEQVLATLEKEFLEGGKKAQFEHLKALVWGDKAARPYAEIAAELCLTESALKVTIHRLRKRYRELLRAEVERTVVCSADIDEELRHLIHLLSN